ncbi:hypothetical protein L211DRAFT_884251 [Terfezia boudieri ATCC MYA-4762]|uniref:HNH nuclease domain-containing protein n=1 Tax=Terfezia boudieri ATCC MYA-4762 TaxID=1051890 RepID=A0A3N4LMP4_9PEZI|nr:hypothetical protein L211DRAFT_884251 [Terfezia boudieri ATCC MYA-4762]
MANNHPSYPPILPRAALFHPLRPLPHEVREALTQRLRQRRRCEVTRGFLAPLNQNLLFAAPADEQQQIMAWLRGQSERALTQLAQTFRAAMRQSGQKSMCASLGLGAGGRTPMGIQAVTNPVSRSPVTRALQPQAAHIVPFSLGRLGGPLQQTMPNIETFLRVFVGPTVVHNLERYLLQGHGSRNQINRVENMLCLAADAHQYFGSGYFVLEPVGDPLAKIQRSTDVRVDNDFQEDAWDLTQVLEPGVPMSEDSDPDIPSFGLARFRLQQPRRPRRPRLLRPQALQQGSYLP